LIRPLYRLQIFTGGFGCRFPWSRCVIATRSGGGRVALDQRTGLKGPQVLIRSDRWIALKSLQEVPDAVFLEVDVESALDQVEVASLEISVQV